MFKDEKKTQYSPLMTREEQAEAVNDMEDVIDDGRRRGEIGRAQSSEYDGEYESVPLRGAGRSLAQRATAHLKSLKKSAKEALKSAFGPDASVSSTSQTSGTSTYGNAVYESSSDFDVGAASYVSRAHARTRSVDLRHVLRDLNDTIEGAGTAAQLLLELRESGGDPDAGEETNDMLDLELSDVCEAHRSHLMQVAQMSDDTVFVSEQQLAKMLDVIEQINVALTTIRSDGRPATAATLPDPSPAAGATRTASLGSSRIEAASTEEEEERMIAEAIAQSLSMQTTSDELARAEAELPPPLPTPAAPAQRAVIVPAAAPAIAPPSSLEQLLGAPTTPQPPSSGPPSANTKVTTEDLLADLIKDM